ncbi:hypothetical protein HPB47_003398 [Ixodes persulcatus]|uniref:Uncharacterized protein n=1 Tax=Ixodes persulcatus TaxID=34615 RepID=A0AC60PIK3_IXOPE|nr:hypothetical protein HPB47_003398 [Ixodes persulcatus]
MDTSSPEGQVAPDNWEEHSEEIGDDDISKSFSKLNVDAPPFVPSFATLQMAQLDPQEKDGDDSPSDKKDSDREDSASMDDSPADWECVTLEDSPAGDQTPSTGDEEERMELSSKPKKKPLKDEDQGPRKEHINVVFIGHVDAGKSTIGGQLLYLTGMVDKRTLEKYEREAKEKNRESWYLSWALDTNQEERDKGKTVEVGRAYFETENKHFTLLDAPGHRQTQVCEWALTRPIGDGCDVGVGFVAILFPLTVCCASLPSGGYLRTKCMVSVCHLHVAPGASLRCRYNECKEKLVPYLRKCGFNPKQELTFMPCSGLTGAFLLEVAPPEVCPWYRGPPFLEYIDGLAPLGRSSEGPFRMPAVDKYKDMGTVVLGKVESGSARRGQQLLLMPNRKTVEVLQLWSDEDETALITSGENVKVKLKGVEEEEVSPGFVLCDTVQPCKVGKIFDAQVVILEHKSIICPGYSAVLHIHAAIEECSVKMIICLVDRKTGEKSKTRPRFVKQDQIAIMRMECAGVVCMEPFKEFPQMGRFTLRDEGRTIAIGKVLRVVE